MKGLVLPHLIQWKILMEQIKEKSMEPKTPYYVIHREEIDVNFKKLENALKKYWNNYIIGY